MTEALQPPPLPRTRPIWVWLIFLFYVVTSAWGLVVQLLLQLEVYPLAPEQQAIVGSVSAASRLYAVFVMVLNIVAATFLWLLRKAALPLFLTGFVLGIGSTFWQMLPGGVYNNMLRQGALMGGITIFSVVFGLLFSGAICWYVWWLWRRGALR